MTAEQLAIPGLVAPVERTGSPAPGAERPIRLMATAVAGWMERAACARPALHSLPWLIEHDQVDPADQREMRRVCLGCPVLRDCAQFVDQTRVSAGFWAGEQRGMKSDSDADDERLAS